MAGTWEHIMERPESAPDPNIKLVTVFETGDPGLMAVVRSILDEAGIEHTVQGESARDVMGWGSMSPPGATPQFQVREEDAAEAVALLRRLTN